MSEAVPEWDLADRMRKSLRHAEIGVQEMADYLGVARNTVSTWINGRIVPDHRTLLLWASRTGVPLGWLEGKTAIPTAARGVINRPSLTAAGDARKAPTKTPLVTAALRLAA